MTPLPPADRPDWLAYINRTPALLDVLWDLGVLPDQVTAGSDEDLTMLRIAAVWALAAQATREAAAAVVEPFGCTASCGIDHDPACYQTLAAAIRAQGVAGT